LSTLDGHDLGSDAFGPHSRENAMLQIQGSLSFLIERVHGDDTGFAAVANENRRHRTIDGMRGMNTPGESPSWTDKVSRVSI
jgi:hypothetical protein